MAKTKRKRRRKHRGTQSGSVRQTPRGRPRSRGEAKARARQGSGAREPKPPTWQSAAFKGLLASVLFFAVFVLLFGRPIAASLGVAAFMLAFYVPLSYFIDGFMYRRFQRKQEAERAS